MSLHAYNLAFLATKANIDVCPSNDGIDSLISRLVHAKSVDSLKKKILDLLDV